MAAKKVRDQGAAGSITRTVTSTAVARAAGVSQSTVSLVMSGKAAGRVTPATRTLVEETARRLGYRPNILAQVLRTGEARILALAVPNVQQPFFGQVLVAAERAAREHDYSIILIDTAADPRWADRLLDMLHSRLVAGCIVYAGDDGCYETLIDVQDRLLFVEAEDPRRSGIDLDLAGGMRDVVRHLAELGHRRVGYLAAAYPKATYQRRFDAFLDEMGRRALPFDPSWRAASTFELDVATSQASDLLGQAGLSAVFCDDDLLAGAVYRAAGQLGIDIPGQLSVVGFNDIEMARWLAPELTTVAIPTALVGRQAVERLLGQVLEPTGSRPPPVIAGLRLQIRQSTAPVAHSLSQAGRP